jgi:hypothetical protein
MPADARSLAVYMLLGLPPVFDLRTVRAESPKARVSNGK